MKNHQRCGCDCYNQTEYAPCLDENGDPLNELPCCEHCDSAPCAYAVLWECAWGYSTLVATADDHPPIELLWKECLFGCEWSSRYCNGHSINEDGCLAALCSRRGDWYLYYLYDYPCRTNENGDFWNPQSVFPPTELNPLGTGLEWSKIPYECCRDLPIAYPPGNIQRCGWRDYYNMDLGQVSAWSQNITNCTTVVTHLEVTGTNTATLTTPGNPDIVWQSTDFDCLGRSTFIATGEVPTGVPSRVCVVPANSQFRTPCETAQDACNCKDAGWAEGSITISSTCPGLNGFVVKFTRNGELPCDAEDPGVPCGYFISQPINRCDGKDRRTLYFLLWCNGNQWQIKALCEDANAPGTCEEVCNTTSGFGEYCPDGALVDFSCPSFGECCGCCTDCSADVPSLLNVDITGPGNGSGAITTTGGIGCTSINLSNGDRMSVKWNGIACTIQIDCNGADCVFSGCLFAQSAVMNSCDPYDMTVTVNVGFLCLECGFGTYTIHFYE